MGPWEAAGGVGEADLPVPGPALLGVVDLALSRWLVPEAAPMRGVGEGRGPGAGGGPRAAGREPGREPGRWAFESPLRKLIGGGQWEGR